MLRFSGRCSAPHLVRYGVGRSTFIGSGEYRILDNSSITITMLSIPTRGGRVRWVVLALLMLDQLSKDNRQPPGFLVGKFVNRFSTEALGRDYALVTWSVGYRLSRF